ncbi:conserved exported hypothetical protein [Verrucomicrobia bacterium]|nr:conserved exported hypothetical protein [Verrucomicrobiota bacterium]
MKKPTTLIFAASTMFLAGCCTTPHATKWEYKVADLPHHRPPGGLQELRDDQQSFLNDLGKEGWVLIAESDGTVFYFKRPLK